MTEHATAEAAARLEADVLARIRPTPAQQAAMEATCRRLEAAADAALAQAGVRGEARVQGSVAKGTWLAGGGDVDLFLLLDTGVPQDALESIALKVGPKVLVDARKRYAQHPYLMGRFEDAAVDLVPAYAVASASAKMSAVDRTPFHTAWVKGRLDAAGRDQVRLAKRWMKGVEVYGAQTEVGGFSGYLVEVLVAHHGSFHGVLRWLASGATPRRIALGADQVQDDVAPLVVVDPVDPARNCAAAVAADVLGRATEAAQAYLNHPRREFFFPPPPRAEEAGALALGMQQRGEHWSGVLLRPRTQRLDLVFPQFQRAARMVADALERNGFPVQRLQASHASEGREILLQWATAATELPPTRHHEGPPATTANAERFRAKWSTHPDAAGPVVERPDGILALEVLVRERTAPAWLRANLHATAQGKHVRDALADATVLTSPADAPPAWRPAVADFVLDRRPWTR